VVGHRCVLASRRMAVHTSLQSTRSPEGMSSRKNSKAEAKQAAGSSGARSADGSEHGENACRPAQPGLEAQAAAMWPRRGHLAAAPLADVPRPAEPARLPGRQAFEACERRGASAAKRRSGGSGAGAEVPGHSHYKFSNCICILVVCLVFPAYY